MLYNEIRSKAEAPNEPGKLPSPPPLVPDHPDPNFGTPAILFPSLLIISNMSFPVSRPMLASLGGHSRGYARVAAGASRSLHRQIRPSPIAGPSRLPLGLPTPFRRAASTSVHLPSSPSNPIPPAGSSSIKVTAPSLDAIKQDGCFDDDAALISPEEAKIVISPEALTVRIFTLCLLPSAFMCVR